ncbi:MAG: fatty acyl-AMP ligase [Thainema sp.]
MTWVDILRDRNDQQSDQVAFQFWETGESLTASLTYGALDQRSRAVAAQLQARQLQHERVLILCQPGLDYIVAFCACLYAGAIAVPIYPPRPNQLLERLQAIAADAQPAMLLTTQAFNTQIKQLDSDSELNSFIRTLPCLVVDQIDGQDAGDWQAPEIQADTIALLQYTSGSTASPKGVQVSHGNLLHNAAAIRQRFELTPASSAVIWLPPYHDMGLIGGILQPIYAGFPVTLMPPVAFLQRPLRWLQAIAQTRATVSGAPNFAYDLCVQRSTPEQRASLDLSHWTLAFTGAEPIRADTLDRFATAFADCGFRRNAFYPCYGMAEATLMVTGGLRSHLPKTISVCGDRLEQHHVQVTDPTAPDCRVLVGCGSPIADSQVVIVNPDTRIRCQPNEIGEIWVASPSVAHGYWNRPQQTLETFHVYLADTSEGPFLRTGDLGWMEDGELVVTGRLKEVMVIRGRNHYASDLEKTVVASHPALGASWGAAFTIEQAGATHLVIVQEVTRTWIRQLQPQKVITAIRQRIAQVHGLQVDTVVLVKPSSLPKTSSGKIQRHRCRSQFLANQLQSIAEDRRALANHQQSD